MEKTEQQKKIIISIDSIILNDWIKCAQAGIIKLDEARKYVEDGFIAEWQFKNMFPKQ